MVHVLVHHKVSDYKNWRLVFDAALELRQRSGERGCRVFRSTGDPNDLTLLFEWEDLEQAQRYMTSAELRRKMQEAGVEGTPEIQYLGEMYTVRRSAAD
jgi:quinol monooxygenase YgiN